MERLLKIKLIDRDELVSINTSVNSFKEFQELPEVQKFNIDWSKSRLLDLYSKMSIDLEDTLIPNRECILLVVPRFTDKGNELSHRELVSWIGNYKKEGGEVPFNHTHATTQQLKEFRDEILKEEIEEYIFDRDAELIDLEDDFEEGTVIHLKPGKYIIIVEENNGINVEELVDARTIHDIKEIQDNIIRELKG